MCAPCSAASTTPDMTSQGNSSSGTSLAHCRLEPRGIAQDRVGHQDHEDHRRADPEHDAGRARRPMARSTNIHGLSPLAAPARSRRAAPRCQRGSVCARGGDHLLQVGADRRRQATCRRPARSPSRMPPCRPWSPARPWPLGRPAACRPTSCDSLRCRAVASAAASVTALRSASDRRSQQRLLIRNGVIWNMVAGQRQVLLHLVQLAGVDVHAAGFPGRRPRPAAAPRTARRT